MYFDLRKNQIKQAGAELGQFQLKLGLDFILFKNDLNWNG